MNRRVLVLLSTAALLAAGCGSSSKSTTAEKTATAPPKQTATSATTPTASPTAVGTEQYTKGCASVAKPSPKSVTFKKPTEKLSAHKTYVAVVTTNCGTFEITLDSKRAPVTGGSFKFLADHHFYDDLTFHRIVAGFVIQGGDPKGDGTGGPGYEVVENPPSDLKYVPGVVAMAKTSAEPSGASGSQFFVVTGDGGSSLPPQYALLGKVTAGMSVVDNIGNIPADPNTGTPGATVLIKSIVVSEK